MPPELLSKTLSVAGKGDSVASTLVRSLADNDGGTINTKTGELLNDEPVYVVSIYPERGVQYKGKNLTEANVDTFIETNGDLLSQDQNSLGVFYDDGTKTTDLDVVVATPDKDLAVALGKKFNQKSIWDAANKDIIETGGTGERVTIDIPEGERVRRTQDELKQGFRPDVDPNDTTLAFRKPRTEAGTALVEDGFSFGMDDFGGGSTFELEFRDNGTVAGTLNASLIDGDTANVGSVYVSPQYRRKGIAEALYREFATELQKKGVTKLTGTTINKAPFDLRKKVFGDFENVELVARGVTPDKVRIERRADIDPAIARKLLPDPSEGFQAVSSMNIEPTSRIDPNTKFKPTKKPTFASKADQDSPPLVAKSWILPDGEFVPLKRWPEHEDFLIDQTKDLQKLYKTPKNLKGDKAAAVAKHGFTRMTYERNNGRLNIESSVKAWNDKKLRDQVFSYVVDHLDSVDNMSVTLFDEKGKIAKQDSSQLFLIDDDAAKLDALPLITQERSTRGAFKPRAQEFDLGELDSVATPSKKLAKEIRFPEALPVAYQKHKNGRVKMDSKRNPIPVLQDYDLENTALARQIKENGGTRDDVVKTVADKVQELFEQYKEVPELADGLTWYEETRTILAEKLGDDWDLMAQLLAGTSPGTGVDINFNFAVEAFNMFKQGKFDAKIKKYIEGVEKLKSGELRAEWNADSKSTVEPSDAALLSKWIDTHNLKPQKSNGKLFGFHGPRLLQIFSNRWKENNQGPKVQQFYENLTGQTFGATIDIWMARQLHRLGNEGIADGPWRLLSEVETGVNETDFKFGQEALGRAADALGIKADALQAFLWFLEKDVWGKKGWTRTVGKAKSSFAELLKKIERKGDELVPIEGRAPQGAFDFSELEIESL